ncbi:hypothetical protein [Rhodoferax sediminis]|uniref:hypothetical protein n=1 Tax=Rhodoferax sediminis TaxID=2509614 RepID=UPI001FCED311|nr:hypothetical protein [Rhodoferax sediminis]
MNLRPRQHPRKTRNKGSRAAVALALGAAFLAGASPARADDAVPAAATPFKLTAGLYSMSGGGLPAGLGLDLNLRYTSGLGDLWLGWFRSPVLEVSQPRAGWDRTYDFGVVRFMPSLQVASGGFWGGGVGLETGDTWFAGAGLGRTNLRNYANLNFDPNDAWMLWGGYRWSQSRSLSLQVVRDNRQNPSQQNVHLLYRTPVADQRLLTLDLLAKTGLVDGVPIHRLGLSVTYDWHQYFVRLAYDPQVNFTPQDMWRLSVGSRF